MSPHYDFKKDFAIAEQTEKQMARYLERYADMELISMNDNADYDLQMCTKGGKIVTIEVKEDFTCEWTGNIGVEVASWGRPAGIAISKADFYLYKVHEPDGKIGIYIIKTDDLKQMIKNTEYHRAVVGGDVGSNSKNYLFKLDLVKDRFMYLGRVFE